MKRYSTKQWAMSMISIGLLLTAVSAMWNHFEPIPDTLSGLLAGFGIGLELLGIGAIAKYKNRLKGN